MALSPLRVTSVTELDLARMVREGLSVPSEEYIGSGRTFTVYFWTRDSCG